MSECAGGHSMSRPDDFQMGSVGRGICGTETKIDNSDEYGQGEVSQFETSLTSHRFYQIIFIISDCLICIILLLWLLEVLFISNC